MAALTPAPDAQNPPELVLEWPGLTRPAVRGRAFAISVLLHAVGLAVLLLLGGAAVAPESPSHGFTSSTVLVAPPIEFTQTAPNRAKIGKEFSLDNLAPRPALRAPLAIPHLAPPAPPEPPKVPAAGLNRQTPPALQLGSTQMPGPPPQLRRKSSPSSHWRRPACRPALPRRAARIWG